MKRLGLVFAVCLAGLAQAQDYLTYKMISTAQNPFTVYVDSRSQRPAGLDYTLMQNTVERAWATWNAVQCAYPKVRSNGATGGTVPQPTQSYDDYSVTPVWMLTNDADAQQIFGNTTLVAAITLPKAYAGVLQTCDIYFNGAQNSWSMTSPTPSNSLDVETVFLHEAGHCLGLGHFGGNDAIMDPVVSPGDEQHTLSNDDVAKLCTRYPLVGEFGSPCFGDGGCVTTDLKCVTQPTTNNLTLNLCTRGCGLGTNDPCALPLSCQASSAFSNFTGACLLPGNIVTAVGRACLGNGDCGNSFGFCQPPTQASGTNQFWIDGYCTQSCEPGQPTCPAGSTCAQLDVGKRCLESCRVGLADCRVGYACAQIDAIGTTGVCIPRCFVDQDCADTLNFTCRACDGLCVPRQNISGEIGNICTADAQCGAGQVCKALWPNSGVKQCTEQCGRGCASCKSGSECVPGARGELYCMRNCSGPGSCGAGLRCAQTAVGNQCVPACQSDLDCPVGESCNLGECTIPSEYDAGCSTLTCKPDAGKPIVITPKDGGTGTGGTGGCGCASVDPGFGFALLGLLTLASRRRSWRHQR